MEERQCFCALPDCPVGKTADIAKSQSVSLSQSQSWSQCFSVVSGHGHELSPSAKTIIMNLRTVLPELFKQGYLAHGANWSLIPSKNAMQCVVGQLGSTRLLGTSARTVVRMLPRQRSRSQQARSTPARTWSTVSTRSTWSTWSSLMTFLKRIEFGSGCSQQFAEEQ